MPPITLTQTGTGRSRVHIPDFFRNPFAIGIGCVVTGTVTYNVEHTFDDTQSSNFDPSTATWFQNSGITGATANKDGNYAYPVRGISLNVTAGTGSVVLYIEQAGTR